MLSALEATVKSNSPHASRQWTVRTGARVTGQSPDEPPFSMQPMGMSSRKLPHGSGQFQGKLGSVSN